MPETLSTYTYSPLLWLGIGAWLCGFACAWGACGLRYLRRNATLRAILMRRL